MWERPLHSQLTVWSFTYRESRGRTQNYPSTLLPPHFTLPHPIHYIQPSPPRTTPIYYCVTCCTNQKRGEFENTRRNSTCVHVVIKCGRHVKISIVFLKRVWNSNFHCHIWIQLEKCIKMSTNMHSIVTLFLEIYMFYRVLTKHCDIFYFTSTDFYSQFNVQVALRPI